MRIADRSSARNYLKYLNTAKEALAKTNEQIHSGNRFERLSDDVSAGTRVMHTRMDAYKAEKHLNNVQSVNEELSMTEDTMMSIEDILSKAHALNIKGLDEEKGESGQKAIANEIKSLRDQMLHLINTKYGKKYAFGGSNASMTEPFEVGDDGKLKYNGISIDSIEKDQDGYFYHDTAGNRQPIPMDEDVYMDIGLGLRLKGDQVDDSTGFLISCSGLDIVGFGKNTDGTSNNIFNIMVDMENHLRTYDREKLGACDTQLTVLTDRFNANLTDIGARTKFLDTLEGRLEKNVDSFKTRIDNLMGSNPQEAATTLAMNDYVLKAVLQMGSRILPVSLMDFLR